MILPLYDTRPSSDFYKYLKVAKHFLSER